MNLQRLYSLTRQAIDDYALIESGDKIAVGISGGKDSLTLLYALQGLQKFYPQKFDIIGITVDLGFENFDLSPIQSLCESLEVPYHIVKTEIAPILFDVRKESNPCSLCAKMRKGALNQTALEFGCNKIAYAHHKDDLIETMFLSLMYEGHFYTFSPYTFLDKTELSVIRPLIYVNEADVIGFQRKYSLPVCKNPCPADGKTKREYVKQLIQTIQKENPGTKDCLFHAITDGNIKGWTEKQTRKGR